MRYFIRISFAGGQYHGWQVQQNAHTVQEELNRALGLVLRQRVDTTGCGRTDTGVHALEFYAHFDHAGVIESNAVTHQLNALLPRDLAVQGLRLMSDEAHVRFDAVSRTYRYCLHLRKDPFLEGLSWYYPVQPDLNRMNELAALLLLHEDFSCFSKSGTGTRTNRCRIGIAGWEQEDYRIFFTITADRFLRNMVRAIVGTLLDAGTGKTGRSDFEAILQSRSRSDAGRSVPAHGLYLVQVKYPYPVP
jgi:tRNA pseudouridine38-40 synthase